MPQLLFKRKYFEAIRRGRKTTTLRRWKSCKVHAGGSATTPGLGVLKILDCQRVKLRNLKDDDAKADGFESLSDLRQTLKRLYPNLKKDGKQWYKISFELVSEAGSKENGEWGLRGQKARLAKRVRAELDKAVRRNGSLLAL